MTVKPTGASIDIAASRLRNQKLVRTDCRTPEAVVAWLGAVQAQDYPGARWALGLRTTGFTDSDVDRACDEGRIRAATSHASRAGRGSRNGGIHASGQRPAYLMMRAELDGVICSGGRHGKQSTYALLDERAPRTGRLKRDEALAALATRYFTSHGPASLRDYVWWSGMTVKDAKTGIDAAGGALRRVTIDSRINWQSGSRVRASTPGPALNLLPNYDEYLIAYKDRSSLRDGRTSGVRSPFARVPALPRHRWKVARHLEATVGAGRVVIELRLIRPLDSDERRRLDAEASRFGKFAGMPVVAEGS
jgi:hypothetical protein